MKQDTSIFSQLYILSKDLWWTGDPWANDIFHDLDPVRWNALNHNPCALLHEYINKANVTPSKEWILRAEALLDRYQTFLDKPEYIDAPRIAYFCMEFGLHEFFQIYSGGLGILAGDHIRSAGDLKLPFVGVGLLYKFGYFNQLIIGGQQGAGYINYKNTHLPLRTLTQITTPFRNQRMNVLIHEVKVGGARLLLLDTDVDGNSEEMKNLTKSLYGGDKRVRIGQEMLLGIGGIRALRALDIESDVYHLNEGHAAYSLLELWIEHHYQGLSWEDAWKEVQKQAVFTTHTPVPAGHDTFYWHTVNEYLGAYRRQVGLSEGAFMDKGREDPSDWELPLSMTVLGLNGTRKSNGVSALHGEVSRAMFKDLPEANIGHITNGVHPTAWMAPELHDLLDQYQPGWTSSLESGDIWDSCDIPESKLWEMRKVLRMKLIEESRRILGRDVLDPDSLTIGFARRFATYKRGDLIFDDPDRLEAILKQGVQLVFAGKAHPADIPGQKVLANVLRFARDPRFSDRVIFLPDYNAHIGRLMTQGCDVWLNNPRRPREASGTSGQKAALNGNLNFSILDGWWPEAYNGRNGWAIGDRNDWTDLDAQDAFDVNSMYTLLETEIIPAFQSATDWTGRMKDAIRTCAPVYNTHRMVTDYVNVMYRESDTPVSSSSQDSKSNAH